MTNVNHIPPSVDGRVLALGARMILATTEPMETIDGAGIGTDEGVLRCRAVVGLTGVAPVGSEVR